VIGLDMACSPFGFLPIWALSPVRIRRFSCHANPQLMVISRIEALDGNGDQALINLTDSLIESPEISRWAAVDPDLSSLKGHPLFDDLFLLKMSQPNWIETIES